jgi:hypothetical protein
LALDIDGLINAPLMASAIFGEAVQPTYTPKSGAASFAIDGVFDRPYTQVVIDAEAVGGVGMNTTSPGIGVRLAQFGANPPVQGDKLYVPSVAVTFVVSNVQPDGHGWAYLKLNKVSG